MNKTKTTLAAVGGASFVAVVAAGYFAWSSYSAKTAALEGDDEGAVGLEQVREKAERLSRKPVYPGAESVKALTEAREALAAWKDEAFSFAARGDRRIQSTTDAAFKEFIVADARRLKSLPAGREQKTLDAAFDFGPFKPYIAEGRMPEQASLKELQRKWDDVALLIETLSACGVERISGIDVKAKAVQEDEEEATTKKGKKRPVKKVAQPAQAAKTLDPLSYTYVVTCKAFPAAMAKTMNAMATSDRFMVVEDVIVHREKDMVAEGLGATEKKEEAAPATGRRRRRAAAAAAEEKAEKKAEKKDEEAPLFTIVTDPATDAPFDVRLTVTVYDFRSLETNKDAEDKDGEVTK